MNLIFKGKKALNIFVNKYYEDDSIENKFF